MFHWSQYRRRAVQRGEIADHRRGRAKISVAVLVAMLSSGCATGQIPNPQLIESPVGTVGVSTAALYAVNFLERDTSDQIIMCTGPEPDATYDEVREIALDIGLVNVSTGAAAGVGAQESPLGGRAPSVLITRELMFRLCETAFNYKLSKEEYLSLYRETLSVVRDVGSTSTVEGTATVAPQPSFVLPTVVPTTGSVTR